MDIHHLEYFLQLAKFEHVSQTADMLNISQPALSKSISSLEKELGVSLFDRTGNRIRLNKAGKQFAIHAEQSLQLLSTGILTARSSRFETQGTIRINCYTYAPIITACTNAYTKLNPQLDFIINQSPSTKNPTDTTDGDFILCSSLGNAFEEQKEQFWISQPLFQESMVLIISPRFRTFPPGKTSIDLVDFMDTPFVSMIQNDVFFQDITHRLCQAAGFIPKIYCQTDDFLVKMMIVDEGLAIAILPECCLKEAMLLCPDLQCFSIEKYTKKRTISLMRKKKAIMSEAALDFWDFALDYYGIKDTLEN